MGQTLKHGMVILGVLCIIVACVVAIIIGSQTNTLPAALGIVSLIVSVLCLFAAVAQWLYPLNSSQARSSSKSKPVRPRETARRWLAYSMFAAAILLAIASLILAAWPLLLPTDPCSSSTMKLSL